MPERHCWRESCRTCVSSVTAAMAVACAGAFQASSLLFLTDVEGVRDAEGSILRTLTSQQALGLIRDGVATGGMTSYYSPPLAIL